MIEASEIRAPMPTGEYIAMKLSKLIKSIAGDLYLTLRILQQKESGRRYRGDAHMGVLRMLLLT
jgi:hypothetical protein